MPIAAISDFAGATLEQYDQIIEKLGFTPGGPGTAGCLMHCVAATDNGLRVVDVWESRELFEAFSREKIGPLSAEVGFPGQPETTIYDVHNYLTAGPPV